MAYHLLEEVNHVILMNERHLAVYLCKLGLTVGSEVFVTETFGYLEVAIEAAHHEQLLQCLRTLWQSIELSWVHSRWHDEVACTLGCRANEYWCLHFDKLSGVEEVAYENSHLVTQLQIASHDGTSQVKIAIFHSEVVASVGVVLHLEWWCKACAQNVHLLCQYLYVACRHLRVLALSLADDASHLNTELASQLVGFVA